jgi:flagellar basal body-associated protein FliL
MMRKQVSTPVVVVIVLVVVAVVGMIGYRMLGSPQSNMTPQQQIESMRHMVPFKH